MKASVVGTRPLLIFLLLPMAVAETHAADQPNRFAEAAQRLVDGINAEDYPAIQLQFTSEMAAALPLDQSKLFFASVIQNFGKIERLDPPRVAAASRATIRAHGARRDMEIALVLTEDNKIAGMTIRPAIPVPDKLTTRFDPPFEGQWFVVWGGDTPELNYHHESRAQRYAFDFIVHDEDGQSHRGDGSKNADFYAFGLPVLAPADGVVTDVITGVRDNSPGSMNPIFAGGNAVVIRHQENEVSVLAHFQQGSICVKPGERVKRGQVLGRCGNSGNSSEAHIHFHVQNTPILQDGTGLRCAFQKVTVTRDGKTEIREDYMPIKGDRVAPE